MPELPEVETVRRGLDRTVLNRPISQVEVFHPRTMRRQPGGESEFIEILTGAAFVATARRGKFLWLPTNFGDAMLAHLGMSGQLLVVPQLVDRKSTRLNSSHVAISYAVFCLKKKNQFHHKYVRH